MKGAVFAALLATSAITSVAVAVAQTPPAGGAAQAGARKSPANLCTELAAIVRPLTQAPAPAAAQGPAAASAPQPTPAQQTAVAAPPQGGPTAQPSGQGAPTQSGIPGPTPQATTQGTPGPQAAGQSPAVTQPQAPSGQGSAQAPAQAAPRPAQAAPAAPAAPSAPKPTPAAIEKVEAAARGNDIAGCKAAAQEMRRAGVAMPAPLLALAGLDLKYLQTAAAPQAPAQPQPAAPPQQ
jgi:hypothetical protein